MWTPKTGAVLIAVVLATLIEPLRCKQWRAWRVEKRTGNIRVSQRNVHCGQGFEDSARARQHGGNIWHLQREWKRLSKHDGACVTNKKQMIQLFGISYVGIAGLFGVLSAVCVGHYVADEDDLTMSGTFVYWFTTDYTELTRMASSGEHRERSHKLLYALEAF